MKKKYKIIFKETLTHEFYVEAESPEAAEEEFNHLVSENKIDFSYGEVTDSHIDCILEA